MVKSSIYFLSTIMIIAFTACEQRAWYQKDLTEEQKVEYADRLWLGGYWYHYQGSVADQFQLEEALRLDSTNGDAWREAAIAYLKRGIPDKFYTNYVQAVRLKPEKWSGFRGYVYLYFYRDYERAIADFNLNDQKIGEVAYSQGQSHDYMRGICYYGLKDYKKALEFLNRYIQKVTDEEGESWVDVYAILYKGLALLKLERLDEAMIELDRALKYYPNLSDCFYHKARIYIARGQFDLALKALDKAEEYFKKGYYHQRPYVEVLEQIYLQDILELKKEISTS
ncbi:Tetratricopeptide repeat-containing protein [Ekhidna lutea]|uniref:Tetratricopeptide repeat-containing protein n=1 Tax=Ekhidna lutea TaxID=447679 RepID=A0A239F1Y0_EKHLU|nr:tetratricopeptide repeat protein [Ekhidna lutea]SNS50152.1 Tetratricopeptide repeat-containing protein [Ekhidna lutea]